MLIFSHYLSPLVYLRDTEFFTGSTTVHSKEMFAHFHPTAREDPLVHGKTRSDGKVQLPPSSQSEKAKPRGKSLTTLMLKERQVLLRFVFKLEPKAGKSTSVSKTGYLLVRQEKKGLYTEKSNKGFLLCSKSTQAAFSSLP